MAEHLPAVHWRPWVVILLSTCKRWGGCEGGMEGGGQAGQQAGKLLEGYTYSVLSSPLGSLVFLLSVSDDIRVTMV